MTRWLFLLAFLPNCTGCLAYAYPKIAYTPPLTVPNADSVHAFRVDVDCTESTNGPAASQYTISRLPIDEGGNLPSQMEIAHATGVYKYLHVLPVAEGAPSTIHERNQYSMLIRLYRPGYRTIEIQSWEKPPTLLWVAAKDLTDQETAIDLLLKDPTQRPDEPQLVKGTFVPGPFVAHPPQTSWWTMKDQESPKLGLQSGRASQLHRSALLFAAGEYERLARTARHGKDRNHLERKAAWLRAYADAPPDSR